MFKSNKCCLTLMIKNDRRVCRKHAAQSLREQNFHIFNYTQSRHEMCNNFYLTVSSYVINIRD